MPLFFYIYLMPSEPILLKYSQIYDANISLASGHELTDAEIAEGYAFVENYVLHLNRCTIYSRTTFLSDSDFP